MRRVRPRSFELVGDGTYNASSAGNLDGSNVEDVAKDIADDLLGLAVDAAAGEMYWVERGVAESRIVRAGLEGRGREGIYSTEDSLSRLTLDTAGKRMFVTFTTPGHAAGAGVRRIDLEDGNLKDIVAGDVYDIAVDGAGGKIYWVQEGQPDVWGTDIWRADFDGTGPEPILHHPFEHHTTGIALDTHLGKIYWATINYRETHAQIVERANLDGSEVEPVTNANPGLDDWPVFIDLDLRNRMAYWVNGEDGVFYRVSIDGGEAEMLHEDAGPYGPFDMVVASLGERPAEFRRGDVNGSGTIDLSDPISILGTLFLGSGDLPCRDAADVSDDGVLDITDAIASLTYLFLGGFNIPPPGPLDCGVDSTASDALDCGDDSSCRR